MQVDLCGVAGAEPRDAETFDVVILIENGCREAAAKLIRRNMRMRLCREVKMFCGHWESGNRVRFAERFDAMVQELIDEAVAHESPEERRLANGSAINQPAVKQAYQAYRQYSTQAASGQAKATEGAKGAQAKRG